MNYFKKTKFRETSLIFVAVFLVIIYFTISDSSEDSDVDVQALIDAAVEEAVEEALSISSEESTTTTTSSTTTSSTTSSTTTTTTTTTTTLPPPPAPPDIKEITFKDSPVLNWYDESAPLYYKRTDEEIEQLNEYHSQEGNERILSITDSDGNEILNNVKIFFGTNSDVLNKGVGHYITSADPSMYKGNVAIAGYSKDEVYTPFENLHTVIAGSKIRWTHVPSGTYWEYTISKTFITSNSDISVLETVISDANADATITLITEDIYDPSKILVLNGYLTDGNETG